jgi:pilus assembly protein CpaD
MTRQRTTIGPRSSAARRLLTAASLVALLGGCQTQQQVAKEVYPNDYRQRHPITLKEGEQGIEVFIGRNRGGLSPSQRADVLAFTRGWRREGTSGIIIDVPRGGDTDRAAADSLREITSILAAAGVPRRAIYLQQYHPSPLSLTSIKIKFSKLTAEAGPCGLWPHDLGPGFDKQYSENRPY